MSSTIGQPRARRRRGWLFVVAVVVAIGGLVAWATIRGGDPFAAGTRSFSADGVTLTYPAGWIVNDKLPASSGLGSTLAILGTQPWGLCLPFDINCHNEQRLEPSQISVSLRRGILGGATVCEVGVDRSDLAERGPSDPPATGHLVRVDARPTIQTDYAVNGADYYHADAWRNWAIAAPGSTSEVYWIEAMYRGPGAATFNRQLDDLIASVRFDPVAMPPDAGPTDCGAPFP
jgi:hypothetical protein